VPGLHAKTNDSSRWRCHYRLLDGRKPGKGGFELFQSFCGKPICLVTRKSLCAASFYGITAISLLSPFISGCRGLQQY
jgi:hypothetical protein